MLHAAAWCAGRWVVVGATADARGNTRPAAWESTDARQWRPLRIHPGTDYYAVRAVLGSVGCARGRLAALGEKPGGAHGNPRVETWRQRADGSLSAVRAPFVEYGGQDAVAVHRLSGGDGGFLASGVRVSGAAVWTSRSGARFTLHERAPGLASTPAASTQALDAVWWRGSWTVVGDATLASGRLVAAAWTGTGAGPWAMVRLPGGARVATGERVVLTGSGPVVAGLDDRAFATWAEAGGRWVRTSTFGQQRAGATSPSFVSGLAVTDGLVAATYSDGVRFGLAVGPVTRLSDARLPVPVESSGDDTVTLAAHAGELLLLTDDGAGPHVWLTHLP